MTEVRQRCFFHAPINPNYKYNYDIASCPQRSVEKVPYDPKSNPWIAYLKSIPGTLMATLYLCLLPRGSKCPLQGNPKC